MLCCLAVMLVVAGCGGSDSPSTDAASTTDTTTPAKTTTTPAPIKNTFTLPKSPGAHPGAKVERLIVKDVVKGTGAELHPGDSGYFEFVLSDWNSGKVIDKSWGKKKPFLTQIEHNVVIEGWVQGIPGMHVGGRRTVLIPPSLGFVGNPNPKVNGKTTYFDIVLLGVVPAAPPGVGGGQAAGGGGQAASGGGQGGLSGG